MPWHKPNVLHKVELAEIWDAKGRLGEKKESKLRLALKSRNARYK